MNDDDLILGLLWDLTRPGDKPLWWCLDRGEKTAFHLRVLELARTRDASLEASRVALLADLRRPRVG